MNHLTYQLPLAFTSLKTGYEWLDSHPYLIIHAFFFLLADFWWWQSQVIYCLWQNYQMQLTLTGRSKMDLERDSNPRPRQDLQSGRSTIFAIMLWKEGISSQGLFLYYAKACTNFLKVMALTVYGSDFE